MLRQSAFARMQARLESLPVIEEAKGILRAQQRCASAEAFDLLRRAFQRANLKLHVLAMQMLSAGALDRSARGLLAGRGAVMQEGQEVIVPVVLGGGVAKPVEHGAMLLVIPPSPSWPLPAGLVSARTRLPRAGRWQ